MDKEHKPFNKPMRYQFLPSSPSSASAVSSTLKYSEYTWGGINGRELNCPRFKDYRAKKDKLPRPDPYLFYIHARISSEHAMHLGKVCPNNVPALPGVDNRDGLLLLDIDNETLEDIIKVAKPQGFADDEWTALWARDGSGRIKLETWLGPKSSSRSQGGERSSNAIDQPAAPSQPKPGSSAFSAISRWLRVISPLLVDVNAKLAPNTVLHHLEEMDTARAVALGNLLKLLESEDCAPDAESDTDAIHVAVEAIVMLLGETYRLLHYVDMTRYEKSDEELRPWIDLVYSNKSMALLCLQQLSAKYVITLTKVACGGKKTKKKVDGPPPGEDARLHYTLEVISAQLTGINDHNGHQVAAMAALSNLFDASFQGDDFSQWASVVSRLSSLLNVSAVRSCSPAEEVKEKALTLLTKLLGKEGIKNAFISSTSKEDVRMLKKNIHSYLGTTGGISQELEKQLENLLPQLS